jgi:hypothetical protein
VSRLFAIVPRELAMPIRVEVHTNYFNISRHDASNNKCSVPHFIDSDSRHIALQNNVRLAIRLRTTQSSEDKTNLRMKELLEPKIDVIGEEAGVDLS